MHSHSHSWAVPRTTCVCSTVMQASLTRELHVFAAQSCQAALVPYFGYKPEDEESALMSVGRAAQERGHRVSVFFPGRSYQLACQSLTNLYWRSYQLACMHDHDRVKIYTYRYIDIDTHRRIDTHTPTYSLNYTRCICIYVFIRIHMHKLILTMILIAGEGLAPKRGGQRIYILRHTHTRPHTHTHTHTHSHTNIHTRIYVCVHLCMYIFVYMYDSYKFVGVLVSTSCRIVHHGCVYVWRGLGG